MQEKIIIIDFGSQYTQLIGRRVRELNVYSEIHPFDRLPQFDEQVKGVILSGSPFSVLHEQAPHFDFKSIRGKFPILGICYGAQYMAKKFGGEVKSTESREYGRARLNHIDNQNPLMQELSIDSQVWMSHGDSIHQLGEDFEIIGSTEEVKVAAFHKKGEPTYGIQFHPEVYHTTEGIKLLKNFIVNICKAEQNWTPAAFAETSIADLSEKLGNDKVVLGLSGGVDSSVAAILLHQAIGKNLYCIFVDNGLLRKHEYESVLQQFKGMGLNIKGVDAKNRFYNALQGIKDPEQKRKTIGRVFIEVFEDEAHAVKEVQWLAQGTIYPDVIESISVSGGPSATIKSHHNVGGLPELMNLKVVEPLRLLFKDEVRRVGKSLGLPEQLLGRHPFPGPGLAIRILGDVTAERVRILQEVDHIFIEGLRKEGLYDEVWQAGAILLPIQSVGVMGDERTYEMAVALRAVSSTDGMTADWCHLPYDFLAKTSNYIINQVKGVNRVVYDISSKPPATIEWE